jgi:hypothetical protein
MSKQFEPHLLRMTPYDVASNTRQALPVEITLLAEQRLVVGGMPRGLLAAPQENDAAGQGLTLVDFSAQRKRFLWDKGCM